MHLKKIILTIVFLLPVTIFSQKIKIPDPNFEKALIETSHDSDGNVNGEMWVSDAEKVEYLSIDGKMIKNLTGLNAFPNLKLLSAQWNSIESIDLSNNPKLSLLFLDGNRLKTIDISQNNELEIFSIKKNKIELLDLSNKKKLKTLNADFNMLKSVDVKNIPNLDVLSLRYNELNNLDISNNLKLYYLDILGNQDLHCIKIPKNHVYKSTIKYPEQKLDPDCNTDSSKTTIKN